MKASLLTNLINIQYLTGFKSSHAYLLRAGRKNYVITDARYTEKALKLGQQGRGRIGHFDVIDISHDFKKTWRALLKKHRITTVEFEGNHMTVNQHQRWQDLAYKSTKWENGVKDVWDKRAQKDTAEIRKLKRSQEINEQIFNTIKKELKPGVTELEIGQRIQELCPRFGSEGISFDPIVAFGANSSMPHHENTSKKLKKGDLVLIDMGVLYQGYASDMTRMLFTKAPTPEQEKAYNLVLDAQCDAIDAMKPRVKASKPDQIARNLLGNQNEFFTHSLGHGIGLEVHEPPTLSTHSDQTLKPGMVVTSEPGLYYPGKFGIRIEDMILITQTGHQNLTKVPKRLKDCILT